MSMTYLVLSGILNLNSSNQYIVYSTKVTYLYTCLALVRCISVKLWDVCVVAVVLYTQWLCVLIECSHFCHCLL